MDRSWWRILRTRDPGGGNGKWFQYTYCENPMNYIRRQKDMTSKDVIRVRKTCTGSCCFPSPPPSLKGWMLWPYSFHFTAWCEIRAEAGLTMQRPNRAPGVWSRQAAETTINVYWVAPQEREALGRHWILGRQMLGRSTQWFLFQ